jgi:AcrR family transcriptional regulator
LHNFVPILAGPGLAVTTHESPTSEGSVNAGEAKAQNGAVASSKFDRTKAMLIDAALTLFKDRGFDATTMRAIAAEAGVSVGNAYYYFDSKEHLIQGFYDRAQHDHLVELIPKLEAETSLEGRIIASIDTWITVMEPYRAFAKSFFRNAADPSSPLSPFSAESGHSRQAAVELWSRVVDGATEPVPAHLQPVLPELLWLFAMGNVLFWVNDRSDRAVASRLLIRRLSPLLVRVVRLADVPALEATVTDLVALISDLKRLTDVGSEIVSGTGS